jgi:hypothetical protein
VLEVEQLAPLFLRQSVKIECYLPMESISEYRSAERFNSFRCFLQKDPYAKPEVLRRRPLGSDLGNQTAKGVPVEFAGHRNCHFAVVLMLPRDRDVSAPFDRLRRIPSQDP